MKRIIFSPSHTINSKQVVVYPVTPGNFYTLSLVDFKLTSVLTGQVLDTADDDNGLYYRLNPRLHHDTYNNFKRIGAHQLLVSYTPSQLESPHCSNLVHIYDAIDSDDRIINLHMCTSAMYDLLDLHRPEQRVMLYKHVRKLYEDSDDILHFGGSKFPRPILCRPMECDDLTYKVIDPYLQWSPPKFWHQEEFVRNIPESIEGWLHDIIDSFNWDYFTALIDAEDKHPVAELEHLVASVFDVIYEHYLYFGVCKKLWIDIDERVDDYDKSLLVGDYQKQVMINFTELVDTIRGTLMEKIKELGVSSSKTTLSKTVRVESCEVDEDDFVQRTKEMFIELKKIKRKGRQKCLPKIAN